jgi:hypothetical protein
VTGDPSTVSWRETVGLSTSAQLRQTQRALAASQADLTRALHELAHAVFQQGMLQARLDNAHGTCGWKDLAVTAMQERNLVRDQLDDAIAGFRAELAQARAEVFSKTEEDTRG